DDIRVQRGRALPAVRDADPHRRRTARQPQALCRAHERALLSGLPGDRRLQSRCRIKTNPRREAGGYWELLAGRLTCLLRQDTFRFSADVLPRLVTSSYSTAWPSLSVVRPARSTA